MDRDLVNPPLRCSGRDRISEKDALRMFTTRNRDVWKIAAAADEKREKIVGDAVTYVRNQNINVTNICINACGFCGFSKKPGDEGCYFHDETVIREKAALAKSSNVTEICTVSGLHPAFTAQSYIDVYRWITDAAPGVHLHASNPMEVAYAAKRSGMTTKEVLSAMKAAGLASMCGTAAEILVDPVRGQDLPAEDPDRRMGAYHQGGPPPRHPHDGDHHVRPLRERCGPGAAPRHPPGDPGRDPRVYGICPALVHPHEHPDLPERDARAGATGREDILMVAVARLFLDNFRNIQVSWVKEGIKMAQLGLLAGANDLGGTMFEESISKGAGATNTDYLDPDEMQRVAEDLGRTLCRRTTLYRKA